MFCFFRKHRPFLLTLVGALLLRVVAAVLIQQHVDQTPGRLCLIEGDAEGYWILGQKLAAGEEYAIYEPPRRMLRMPGFPLFLAASMKVVGERPLAVRLLLAVVGTLACGLTGWLGSTLFNRTVGLYATALAAISPGMIVFSVLLLSETLFSAALVASLIALAKLAHRGSDRQAERPAIWLAACAGALIGLATLVRPTWLLVGPGFALVYLLRADRKGAAALRGMVLLAGLAVVLAPWVLHGARVTGGRFVPTTLWVGPSLYDGLHPGATGASDMSFIEQDQIYARFSEFDADRLYRSKAAEFAAAHPARALELAGIKLWRFWSPWPNAAQFGQWGTRLAISLYFLLAVGLAGLGGWQARNSFWSWFLAASPILYFSAVHMVFVGSLRYRLPAEYALLVLTAAGVYWFFPAGNRT